MSNERSEGQLSGDLGDVLADEATWAQPPPEVETGILSLIAAEAESKEPAMSGRGRLVPTLVVGAAVLAFVVAFAAGVFRQEAPTEYRAILAGSELTPGVEGTAIARPNSNGWWIRLDVTGLPPADQGSFYEGWVWSGENTVSIGTFHMRGGDGYVVLWSGVGLDEYTTLLVTVQDQGGGFAPSDLVVLTGDFSEMPG